MWTAVTLLNTLFILELMMKVAQELSILLPSYLCWEHMRSTDQALEVNWQQVNMFMSSQQANISVVGLEDVYVSYVHIVCHKFESKADLTADMTLNLS